MVATRHEPRRRRLVGPLVRTDVGEGGFTLVEFMIAAAITTIVLSGTVMLATQIQQAYSMQLDDAVVEQEARYALDWIARDLRSATNDPYGIIDDQEDWLDPNGGTTGDSIWIRADVNPPDGALADEGEDVTIAFDSANNVITRQDPNDPDDPEAVAMTEAIFTDLRFTYLDEGGMETATPSLVASVQVQVTAQSRARNPFTGEYTSSTLSTEVRLRTR